MKQEFGSNEKGNGDGSETPSESKEILPEKDRSRILQLGRWEYDVRRGICQTHLHITDKGG